MPSYTLYAVQLPQSAVPVITMSDWATMRSKMSGEHGIAALADSPRGPFFSTTDTCAPVRAARDSAIRVMSSEALGLPLSSTEMRKPVSEVGDGANVARLADVAVGSVDHRRHRFRLHQPAGGSRSWSCPTTG